MGGICLGRRAACFREGIGRGLGVSMREGTPCGLWSGGVPRSPLRVGYRVCSGQERMDMLVSTVILDGEAVVNVNVVSGREECIPRGLKCLSLVIGRFGLKPEPTKSKYNGERLR